MRTEPDSGPLGRTRRAGTRPVWSGPAVARVSVVHPPAAAESLRRPRDNLLVRERAAGDGVFDARPRTLPPVRPAAVASTTTAASWRRPRSSRRRRSGGSCSCRCTGRRSVAPTRAGRGGLRPSASTHAPGGCWRSCCRSRSSAATSAPSSPRRRPSPPTSSSIGTGAQSVLLGSVRASILVLIPLVARADRFGRRRLITFAAVGGIAATALGAFSPNVVALGRDPDGRPGVRRRPRPARRHHVGRGDAGRQPGVGVLAHRHDPGPRRRHLPVGPPPRRPRASRLADPLPPPARLPGDRRTSSPGTCPRAGGSRHPTSRPPIAGHGRRFWLLAVTGLTLAFFATPASQLGNEFLRDERGFSAAGVTDLHAADGDTGRHRRHRRRAPRRRARPAGRRCDGHHRRHAAHRRRVRVGGLGAVRVHPRREHPRRPHRARPRRLPAGAVPHLAPRSGRRHHRAARRRRCVGRAPARRPERRRRRQLRRGLRLGRRPAPRSAPCSSSRCSPRPPTARSRTSTPRTGRSTGVRDTP